ncbi:MAG: DUF1592 domain-containing protein [Myxococcota bacterium]|nr:DUF1592 domain-containing protein [Myxococcota bacterium]
MPRHGSLAAALLVSLTLLAAGCEGQLFDAPAGPTGPMGPGPDPRPDPPVPGLEFACAGEVVDPGPSLVRRMTIDEYIATVQASVGVDVGDDARRLLPRDLRADGFSNTAAALITTIDHVAAYEELARLAVERADVAAIAGEHAGCTEVTQACARELALSLGQHLYRAPPTEEELAALAPIADAVSAEGEDFTVVTGLMLEAMMQSPRFLYRVERETGAAPAVSRDLDGWEMASRLSYLVLGAPPDAALLAAAADDALRNDADIEAHVRRMLAEERARATSRRFASDWLRLGRLENLARDEARFPDWDPALGHDMRDETLALFDEIAWSGERPLTDLFDAEETFLTGRLATHYGLEPTGDAQARYDLSEIPERGGLLTQGAVLTVGGDGSSMVGRGIYLLETFLCGHLDSPPPGVDTTPPDISPGNSQREYSEGRVANPSCAGCHIQMEPIAWGIERFDATGSHQLEDEFGNALQQDGWLRIPGQSTQTDYSSVAELAALLATSERARDCASLKATQFAIGRPLAASDGCSLRDMRDRYVEGEGTWTDLVVAIATSPGFRAIRVE